MSANIFEGTAQSPAMMPSPQAYTSYVNGSRQRKDHRLRNIGLAVGAGSLLALGGYAMMNSGEVAEAAEETEEALEEEAADLTSETEEEITEFAGNAEQPVLATAESIQTFPSEDFYQILNDFDTADGISGEEAVQIVTRMRDSGVNIPSGPISEESAWRFLTNRPEFMQGGLIPNEVLFGPNGIWTGQVTPAEFLTHAEQVPLDQRIEIFFQNTMVPNTSGAYTFEEWQTAANSLFESVGNDPEMISELNSRGFYPDMTEFEYSLMTRRYPDFFTPSQVGQWESLTTMTYGYPETTLTEFNQLFGEHFNQEYLTANNYRIDYAAWNNFVTTTINSGEMTAQELASLGIRPNMSPENIYTLLNEYGGYDSGFIQYQTNLGSGGVLISGDPNNLIVLSRPNG